MTRCEHCRFFQIVMVQGTTPGDRLLGHCHRFPPPEGKATPLKAGAPSAEPSNFPLVRASHWCGEFQPTTSPIRRMSAPAPAKPAQEDHRLVVSAREAAAMLDVSERHLFRMSIEGHLPRVRIGARVCFRIESLRAWIIENERFGA